MATVYISLDDPNRKVPLVPSPRSGAFGPVTAPTRKKWFSPNDCGLSGWICEVGIDDCETRITRTGRRSKVETATGPARSDSE